MLVQPVSTPDDQATVAQHESTQALPIEAHSLAAAPFTAAGRGFEATQMPATTDYAQRVKAAINLR